MIKRITEYVNYQFRNKTDEETEELKEEILANLIERYNDLLKTLKDEEKAYIATIKQVGEFFPEADEIFAEQVSPTWSDSANLVSVVFAVFGLIVLFFHLLVGAIMLALSISFFVSAANYSYQRAMVEKKEHGNIEKHNQYLSKIFQFMKTNFIFWSIGISLILANLVQGIILYILGLGFVTTIDFTTINNDGSFVIIVMLLSLLVLILSLIVLFRFFHQLYKRLFNHYQKLTGNKEVKSYWSLLQKELKDTPKFNEKKNRSIMVFTSNRYFILGVVVVSVVIHLFGHIKEGIAYVGSPPVLIYNFYYLWNLVDRNIFIVIGLSFLLISLIFAVVGILFNNKKIYPLLALLLLLLGSIAIIVGFYEVEREIIQASTKLIIIPNIISTQLAIVALILYFGEKNKRNSNAS